MHRTVKKYYLFLLVYAIFLLLGAGLLILLSKPDMHILMNAYHNYFFDMLFAWITHFGNGLAALSIFFVILLFNIRKAFLFGFANLLAGLSVQFLKKVLFPSAMRPVKFFDGKYDLYLIEGVQNHLMESFPSGHTATAFATFLILSGFTKKTTLKVMFFVFAMLTAYSRVYLSQHFFEDIYVGSLMGVVLSLIVAYIFTFFVPQIFNYGLVFNRNKLNIKA